MACKAAIDLTQRRSGRTKTVTRQTGTRQLAGSNVTKLAGNRGSQGSTPGAKPAASVQSSGPAAKLAEKSHSVSGNKVKASSISGGKSASPTAETRTGLSEKDLDMELVQRVQRGDKSGFDLLVAKYQNKILNLVSRYVHDHHEAQDVAQEAFIKAYRGLANFRGDSAFYTWLYRIAINTAKNHLITMGRKVSSQGVDAQEAEQYDGAHALHEYETPERSALNDEIAGVVQKSIAGLPEDLRAALTLREFEGLSYEEIASVMECPIGTVRSRIFRAREAIDANLAPLLDESSRSLI